MRKKTKLEYVRLNACSAEHIYNYLLKYRLIGKFVHILFIKRTSVKYYFVKADDLTITPSNNSLTILEGFACETSDLLEKPNCLSEEEYNIIPESYKGVSYNIYYETEPFLYRVKYRNEENTQRFLTLFPSERVIHYYTCFTSLEEIRNLLDYSGICEVFIS